MNEPPLADNEPLSGDPLAELNRRMQQLRRNADMSYERMSRKVYRSKTALAMADKGVRVPDWGLVSDYVRALCDESADPVLAELQPLWVAARNQRPHTRHRNSIRPGLPSPDDATDPATYVRLLDQLRNSTGQKIRALSERSGLAKSTLNDRFSWKRLWPRDVTERYLRANGLDDTSVDVWLAVYDRLNVAPLNVAPLKLAPEPPAPPAPAATGPDGDPPVDTVTARRNRLAWWMAVLIVVTVLIAVLKTA